jgi:lipopolysaccharide heptosyltransferase II
VSSASGTGPDPLAWASARRILAVRLDGMGDVLMTTPALRAIRASLPDAQLSLLASPAGAEVGRRIPEIDEVIVHRAAWMKAAAEADEVDDTSDLIEELRDRGFDAAVIFSVFSQSALPVAMLCRLAGIPRVLAHVRENPYGLVSDWVRDPEWPAPGRHEVRRQLDLVGAAGFETREEHLSYRVSPAASRRVRELLATLGIRAGSPFVVLHPGATAASRRYRPEGFAAAMARLAVEDRLPIVVTGSAIERPLAERVAAEAPGTINLAGHLDTDELAALIAIAPVLVTNNTGPAHLAAAVGTSVVVLYAQTNVQHMPWQVAARVLTRDVPCRNCLKSTCPLGHHACLAPVEPAEIVEAVRELLAPPPRAAAGLAADLAADLAASASAISRSRPGPDALAEAGPS